MSFKFSRIQSANCSRVKDVMVRFIILRCSFAMMSSLSGWHSSDRLYAASASGNWRRPTCAVAFRHQALGKDGIAAMADSPSSKAALKFEDFAYAIERLHNSLHRSLEFLGRNSSRHFVYVEYASL